MNLQQQFLPLITSKVNNILKHHRRLQYILSIYDNFHYKSRKYNFSQKIHLLIKKRVMYNQCFLCRSLSLLRL